MIWSTISKARHLVSGRKAEKTARQYLVNNGLKFIESNYSCQSGEIDLIMKDKDELVFTEVRYRKSTRFGLPEETVTRQKQIKIIKTAQHYLQHHHLMDQCACRFDIIAIHGTIPNYKINWITHAFDTQP